MGINCLMISNHSEGELNRWIWGSRHCQDSQTPHIKDRICVFEEKRPFDWLNLCHPSILDH